MSFASGPGTKFLLYSGGVVPSGTANGVLYLNGSKVVTSGSALTFDGANLSLGVTPSAWGPTYPGRIQGLGWAIATPLNGGNDTSSFATNAYNSSGATWNYRNSASAALYQQFAASHRWYTAPTGAVGDPISFSQVMTLDANGNLLVGTVSAGAGIGFGAKTTIYAPAGVAQILKGDTSATYLTYYWNTAASGDNKFVIFTTDSGASARGSIDYDRTGGLLRYNTTSDYRAKDIIGPVENSGVTIDALKVYTGKMKGATVERPMLVAHEAQEHAPYAVSGVKDEVNEDGTPKFQQIDVSSLVPLLIAEIQSLRARVAALEAQ